MYCMSSFFNMCSDTTCTSLPLVFLTLLVGYLTYKNWHSPNAHPWLSSLTWSKSGKVSQLNNKRRPVVVIWAVILKCLVIQFLSCSTSVCSMLCQLQKANVKMYFPSVYLLAGLPTNLWMDFCEILAMACVGMGDFIFLIALHDGSFSSMMQLLCYL